MVGLKMEGCVNLFVEMVTYGMLLSNRVDWTVVQSKKNGTENRSLWYTKKKEDSDRVYSRNRNRLATTREIRLKPEEDRA
jgi:hypothetical protein